MRITLVPRWSTEKSLCGDLQVDGAFRCFFLTLPKGDGLPGSAIPDGTYPVTLSPSPKFLSVTGDDWVATYAHVIPHINDIPNRSNILIHWGNDPENTEGCILVGLSHGIDFIGSSRNAFALLHAEIANALDNGQPCELEMTDLNSNHAEVQEAVAG